MGLGTRLRFHCIPVSLIGVQTICDIRRYTVYDIIHVVNNL